MIDLIRIHPGRWTVLLEWDPKEIFGLRWEDHTGNAVENFYLLSITILPTLPLRLIRYCPRP